jgi:hypothetical protein
MPASLRVPGEAGYPTIFLLMVMPDRPIANDDLTELFIARQHPIERLELA